MNTTMFVRERQTAGAPTGAGRADGQNITGKALHPAFGPGPEPEDRTEPVADGAAMTALRVGLLVLAAVAVGVALNLVLVSRLEQSTTQFKELSQFRYKLAAATGPISPVQADHKPLALGTPMALLTIPSIGVKEVVDEGTTSQVLLAGPGHLPSTVFPGGLGTSVIYGRAGTYGGPFGRITQLRKGDRILVTIQNGPTNTSLFKVTDIRTSGQKVPALGRGGARLTLVTAKESMFVPSHAVYVDADIVGSAVPTHRPVVAAQDIPADELPLGMDTSSLWQLFLWLIVLCVAVAAAFWTWRRKGHLRAWIIFLGPIALVGYLLATQISIVLPNLS